MNKWIRAGSLVVAALLFLLPLDRVSGEEQMSSLLREIRQIEFNEINYDELRADYFGYIKGQIPILISAPHGAKHFRTREARWKDEDAYTSSLAIKLGELTGAHVLYVKNRVAEDPNHDLACRYKDCLKEVVQKHNIGFVLDLHGAGPEQPFKIDVGTFSSEAEKSSCPTFKGAIEKAFKGFEQEIFNRRFRARGPGTITSYARKGLGIEAAQMEINANCRIVESKTSAFKANREEMVELIGRLQRMILEINRQMAGVSSGNQPRSSI